MIKDRFYAVTIVKDGPEQSVSMTITTNLEEAKVIANTGVDSCIEEILEFGATKYITGNQALSINYYTMELEDENDYT